MTILCLMSANSNFVCCCLLHAHFVRRMTEQIETHAGELEASVHDYSTVLQIEADHVEATFHRGSVYEKLGKLDEAIADFSKVLSLEPDHVKASYARGTCRNLQGDFAPAIGAHAAPMCMRTAPASIPITRLPLEGCMLACAPQRHIDKLLGAVIEAVSCVQDASLSFTAAAKLGIFNLPVDCSHISTACWCRGLC